MAYAIPSDDAHLVLVFYRADQSHVKWALSAAGGGLGVGNDPRYTSKTIFGSFPFPFPEASVSPKSPIRDLGESPLTFTENVGKALHSDLTITDMYNVLEKLRSGEPLTDKEKVTHEQGLVSVLKQIHDDLDAAVFDAYGWPRANCPTLELLRVAGGRSTRSGRRRRRGGSSAGSGRSSRTRRGSRPRPSSRSCRSPSPSPSRSKARAGKPPGMPPGPRALVEKGRWYVRLRLPSPPDPSPSRPKPWPRPS